MDTERIHGQAPEGVFAAGLDRLRGLFGHGWIVEAAPGHETSPADFSTDRMIDIRSQEAGSQARFVVDLQPSVTPRVVDKDLRSKLYLLRHVNSFTSLLVMSPWISPQTQERLRDQGISYLDLTGNVWIRTDRPAVFIYTQGQSRAPRGTGKSTKATLSGSKVERLVRILADVTPPYRASDLAEATGLSLPYVSRLLSTLEDQLLIQRDGRTIHQVDWQGILRARAEHSDLLHLNAYTGYLAPNGQADVLDQLRDTLLDRRLAITGSYAARELAPLSVGGQLMLYTEPGHDGIEAFADHLGLLPVQESADVLLLNAHDSVVFQRRRLVNGLPHVAPSQLVLDCLSGPGRLPAEGEAVLSRMAADEKDWRDSHIRVHGGEAHS